MAEAALIGVSKRFGDTVAVEDLSLRVSDGEFVVLLGPTGAGKTTTLRLFAGLETPDAGKVEIAGRTVTEDPPPERDVAFVFQQYSLYPHYSVFDNLAFPLRAPGRRRDRADVERRVRDIAAMLRIEDKLGNRATQLSGGEMQRVSIGRALVREPNLFLMDEPLSSLDAKLREDLRVELKRIQRDLGATIVYVTHDQLEAMTLADRIGVLNQGRLEQIAEPRAVYQTPATIYAAQRLGSPQINLFQPGALPIQGAPDAARTIGLRPEDVRTGAEGAPARALTVEHLGVETVALLETEAGVRIHALLDAHDQVREGDQTRVSARPGAAIYFDQHGDRIAAAVGAGAPDLPPTSTPEEPMTASTQPLTALILDCADAVDAALTENEAQIEGLDRAIGDGDHFHNMKRGAETVVQMRDALSDQAPDAALKAIAKKLLSTIGGASGPLTATFFLEMAKADGAAGGGSFYDTQTLAKMVAAGVEGVKMRGKADRGGKTMLDVWIPVSEALTEMAGRNAAAAEIAERLPRIADEGAEATKDMLASKGRAAFLGERAIGHLDPGAKSSAVMIAAVCAHVAARLG